MNTKLKGISLTTILLVSFLLYFYSANIFNLNAYMFSGIDDGLKNYYNFQWHVKYDKSYAHLNNMNYPYGEFLLYEDSMPFYSSITKLVSELFPGIGNYSVGIINFFFFLNLLIGAIFIFLILEHFLLHHYLASIWAILFILLSSQSLLLNPKGHLGLTYCSFFPIGFYLIIRFFENKNKSIQWSFLIAINILAATFTHVYFGFILIFFTLSCHVLKLLVDRNFYRNYFKRFLNIALQVFIPVIVILAIFKIFDTHQDRIILPLTNEYSATIRSIFFSDSSPFSKVYSQIINIDNLRENDWSNTGNYLGFSTNLILLSLIIRYPILILLKKGKRIFVEDKKKIGVYFFAAILVLIFSLGIHTQLLPAQYFDRFPILKQFSSLGRFAWVFFYVISIFSAVALHRLVQGTKFGSILIFVALTMYLLEVVPIHNRLAKQLMSKNVFLIENLPESKGPLVEIDSEIYQAILPLPDFYKAGIPFSRHAPDSTVINAIISSVHTGLPLMSTYLARPSVSEAISIYKMTLPKPYQRLVPEVMNVKKDIAIIFNHCDSIYLTAHEKKIIENARPISSTNLISIYAINPYELSNIEVEISTKKFTIIRDSLFKNGEHLYSDSNAYVYHDDFENGSTNISYRGSASFVGEKEKYNVVAEINCADLNFKKTYSVSFWYYNRVWDQTFNTVIIEEKDASDKTIQWEYYSPIKNRIVDGWWYLSEHDFAPKSSDGTIKIMFKGENKFEDWFAIDDLLIRPKKINVYRIENEKQLFKNNIEVIAE